MKTYTKWAMLATVALVIVVSTAGCTSNTGNTTQSPTPSASQMATYDSGNFTIQYPSDWNTSVYRYQNFSDSVSFRNPDRTTLLEAQLTNYATNYTLSSYTEARLKANTSNQNYTQISAENATLAGYPAYKIVYTGDSLLGTFQKFTEIFTVKDGNLYKVTYTALPKNYDTFLPTTQKMIDSFQIK